MISCSGSFLDWIYRGTHGTWVPLFLLSYGSSLDLFTDEFFIKISHVYYWTYLPFVIDPRCGSLLIILLPPHLLQSLSTQGESELALNFCPCLSDLYKSNVLLKVFVNFVVDRSKLILFKYRNITKIAITQRHRKQFMKQYVSDGLRQIEEFILVHVLNEFNYYWISQYTKT